MAGLRSRLRSWLLPSGPRPAILMYHRIAAPVWDPWDLCVSPASFARQLDWLAEEREVLPMNAFVAGLARGSLPANAIAITFDDGYRDNLTTARPLLAQRNLPATVFVATGATGTGAPFWWDELADLVLGAEPGSLYSAATGTTWEFGERERADSGDWRASKGAVTRRQQAYLHIWSCLRSLDQTARSAAMEDLRGRLARPPPDHDALPMDEAELRMLVEGDLIMIGAHTVNHPLLSELGAAERLSEIRGSMEACRHVLGREVSGFAYPYGDRSPDVVQAVRDCDLAWACSTEHAAADARDLHDLPRIQVLDWSAEVLAHVLQSTTGEKHRGRT